MARRDYRLAYEIAEKQGITASINTLVYRALLSPKLESVDQIDKVLGGIIDWLVEEIHKASGMSIEAGSETEKNSESSSIV